MNSPPPQAPRFRGPSQVSRVFRRLWSPGKGSLTTIIVSRGGLDEVFVCVCVKIKKKLFEALRATAIQNKKALEEKGVLDVTYPGARAKAIPVALRDELEQIVTMEELPDLPPPVPFVPTVASPTPSAPVGSPGPPLPGIEAATVLSPEPPSVANAKVLSPVLDEVIEDANAPEPPSVEVLSPGSPSISEVWAEQMAREPTT